MFVRPSGVGDEMSQKKVYGWLTWWANGYSMILFMSCGFELLAKSLMHVNSLFSLSIWTITWIDALEPRHMHREGGSTLYSSDELWWLWLLCWWWWTIRLYVLYIQSADIFNDNDSWQVVWSSQRRHGDDEDYNNSRRIDDDDDVYQCEANTTQISVLILFMLS